MPTVFSGGNVANDKLFLSIDLIANTHSKERFIVSQMSHSDIQPMIGQKLSRKTSTASECTTMSDYTPENTITSSMTSSPPIISMCPSVSQTPDEQLICHDLANLSDFQAYSQLSSYDTKDLTTNHLASANQMPTEHLNAASDQPEQQPMPQIPLQQKQSDESSTSSKEYALLFFHVFFCHVTPFFTY